MHTTATATAMSVEEWNALYPIGTPVTAYPGTRQDPPLVSVTRTPAWPLGHGTPVVSVEGYSGGIALSHVDPHDVTPPPTPDVITRRRIVCKNPIMARRLVAVLRTEKWMCTRVDSKVVGFAADDDGMAEALEFARSHGWADEAPAVTSNG